MRVVVGVASSPVSLWCGCGSESGLCLRESLGRRDDSASFFEQRWSAEPPNPKGAPTGQLE